jgi:hypothetical protein
VELSLNDSVDVPSDPANDDGLLHKAQHVCELVQNIDR